ncbi:MAG: zinc-binding protein [Anaerolineae bacterium]|nr:zinc-binding protein [Anaerolineae bacterium]
MVYTPGEDPDGPSLVVCRDCAKTAPHCAVCGAPMGAYQVSLPDGRRICGHCHRTAVYDTAQARALFDHTVHLLTARLGLHLRIGAEFTLADAHHLERLASETGLIPHARRGQVVGLFIRKGRSRVMYVLSGLPRTLFIQTVAHEWAHAWQGENCPLLEDALLREGFAEWVAYKTLQIVGAAKKLRLMEQQDGVYGKGLRQMLKLEQKRGIGGVLDFCRRGE